MRRGNRFSWLAGLWLAMTVLAAAGGIAGCATTKGGEAREKVLWQLRDQYVKIEQQDRLAGVAASANDHPANVSADRVRSMLESIELRLPGDVKGTQLFNDDELTILGESISTGLGQAGPEQDVTFAIIGHYPALMGLLRGRMVTTGRVFCRAGELNIIFGDVHRLLRENEDRRLQPFLPGSRGAATSQELRFATKSGGGPFDVKRPDWVAFSLAVPAAPVVAPVSPDAGGTAVEKKAPVAPVGKPATVDRRSAEERLMILNDLHNKKLITDEEYREKRQQILNEL